MESGISKLDYRDYVTQITAELMERVEHQHMMMLKLVDDRQQEGKSIEYCPLVDCEPIRNLREGLREAVSVLEETRSSFKSKRLEELRLKLEALIIEDRN
jgi:hypothetical protein